MNNQIPTILRITSKSHLPTYLSNEYSLQLVPSERAFLMYPYDKGDPIVTFQEIVDSLSPRAFDYSFENQHPQVYAGMLCAFLRLPDEHSNISHRPLFQLGKEIHMTLKKSQEPVAASRKPV